MPFRSNRPITPWIAIVRNFEERGRHGLRAAVGPGSRIIPMLPIQIWTGSSVTILSTWPSQQQHKS